MYIMHSCMSYRHRSIMVKNVSNKDVGKRAIEKAMHIIAR